jgi:1-acyl-sn-glycerol-3-phosphate acyltransferase
LAISTDPTYERGWLPPIGVEIFRVFLKTLFYIVAPIEAQGGENLPAAGTGGYMVAANHVSYWDAPLIFTQLRPHSQLTAFGADKYRRHLLLGTIVRLVGVVWVNRDAPSPATIKAAVQALRNGSVLGIAPEGTRSRVTHALQPAKTGAAYLAVTAGVPIVPTAVIYTDKVAGDLRRFRRSRVKIRFGKPLTFPAPVRQEREAKLEEYTEELMCQIAALLPPEYRGVYADHARLKELLKE